LEEDIQVLNKALKECLSNVDENVISAIKNTISSFSKLILSEDPLLSFKSIHDLEIEQDKNSSIREFQLIVKKKFAGFIELLKSFLNSGSKQVQAHSVRALLDLSRQHITSCRANKKGDIGLLKEEMILNYILNQTIEQENKEIKSLIVQSLLHNLDLAIITCEYYVELLEGSSPEDDRNKLIDAILLFFSKIPENNLMPSSSFYNKNIQNDKKESSKKKVDNQDTEIENSTGLSIEELKKKLQILCLSFLKIKTLSYEQQELLLKQFPKSIVGNLENPLIFSDYLFFLFEKNPDIDIKILALSCIFILIARHTLDMKNYYPRLYSLLSLHLTPEIENSILSSKYKAKFFKLLESSLRTSKLPSQLVASYLKMLSRVALRADASDTLWICSFLYNLLKKNEICFDMIRESATKLKNYDDYNASEKNLLDTHAIANAMWELKSLRNHYSKEVRNLITFFEEIEKNDFLDLEDFTDIKVFNIIQGYLDKSSKIKAAMTVQDSEFENNLYDGTIFGAFLTRQEQS